MHPFAKQIQDKSGQNLSRCYQCKKCTAGCPTVSWYEWPNHSIVRMIQRGMKDELLSSKAIWMCVTCETCGTRCPNGIYLSPIMDSLRQLALGEGRPIGEPVVIDFHRSFMGNVRTLGRLHEATMLIAFKMRTKDFFTDMGVGMKLFLKGKIPLLPKSVKGKAEIAKIFKEAKVKM